MREEKFPMQILKWFLQQYALFSLTMIAVDVFLNRDQYESAIHRGEGGFYALNEGFHRFVKFVAFPANAIYLAGYLYRRLRWG